MSDETPKSEQPGVWRIRYSIATLLLLMATIGLAISLGLTYRKLARTERELDAMRPLPEQEVARQFEKNTTLGPVRTTVKDVRYAPKEDAYKISFSYVISGGPTASPTEWTSSVTLSSYGLGAYRGVIQATEFNYALRGLGGSPNFFSISVETPSPLKPK
jgi:hypothetical protein